MAWLKWIVVAYGVINIAGGVAGYATAGSIWSLAIGGASGALILWLLSQTGPRPAFAWRALGLVSVALAGFWIYRLSEVNAQGKSPMMPMMNLALSIGVFVCLGLGHMMGSRKAD